MHYINFFLYRHSRGCGEQTLSNFEANLYISLYLIKTNSLPEWKEKQAKEKLQLDYTRVTQFITQNGMQVFKVS